MMRYCLLLGLLLAPGLAVLAQEVESSSVDVAVIATAGPLTGLQLASAAGTLSATESGGGMQATGEKKTFKSRWLTANKVHKYFGIGSIGAAGLTLLAPKAEDGAHEQLANAAAALGGAAIVTGLAFHWDDIKLSNGFSDPDNLHMLLTTLGTLGYAKAVDDAPGSQHAGYGGVGAASMALGIKMVW